MGGGCCGNFWRGCYIPTCDFRGCCGFPHGTCYTIMGIIMALGGLVMNMYVLLSCFFQRIVQINPVTGEPIPSSERGYGFLSREAEYGITPDYKKCIYYPQEEYNSIFDGWMLSAKAFAFMSGILGFISFCILLMACCIAFSPSMWERWLLWMYLFAAIFIALSFLAFGSQFCTDNVCKIGQGGGWAISTFLFWLVCANTVKSMAHALPIDDYESDDEDDMYFDDPNEKTTRRQQPVDGDEDGLFHDPNGHQDVPQDYEDPNYLQEEELQNENPFRIADDSSYRDEGTMFHARDVNDDGTYKDDSAMMGMSDLNRPTSDFFDHDSYLDDDYEDNYLAGVSNHEKDGRLM